MFTISHKVKYALVALAIAGFTSCSDDTTDPLPVEEKPLRTKIEFATLTPTTAYATPFVDASGKTTVDLSNGNNRYKMFQAMNTYMSTAIRDGLPIDATVLKNMFAN